jgi:hypothetical protein
MYGGIVLGYHGCDAAVGERLLAGDEHLRVSRNDYDWLGEGAYFWEGDPRRALAWAELMKARPAHFGGRVRAPFVVGAVIRPGNCLDLADSASLATLHNAYLTLKRGSELAGGPLPRNEPGFKGDLDLVKRRLDCAVINLLHSVRRDEGLAAYDSVRAPFFEGRPLFPGSKIMARTHVQLCVRDPAKSILGYFRPQAAAMQPGG